MPLQRSVADLASQQQSVHETYRELYTAGYHTPARYCGCVLQETDQHSWDRKWWVAAKWKVFTSDLFTNIHSANSYQNSITHPLRLCNIAKPEQDLIVASLDPFYNWPKACKNITIPLHLLPCEWTLTLPNFHRLSCLSAIILFQTCKNK